jgi:hypothetical protein
MTTKHTTPFSTAGNIASAIPGSRDAVGLLFAIALEGEQGAEAALHLLGGWDESAHRASWALLTRGCNPTDSTPPDVLASIDRTLAALRTHQSDPCTDA